MTIRQSMLLRAVRFIERRIAKLRGPDEFEETGESCSPFDCWAAVPVPAPTNARAWTDEEVLIGCVAFVRALATVARVIVNRGDGPSNHAH
jgi:hypothetical protein